MAKAKLGEILLSGGHVTNASLQLALSHQQRNRIRVGQSLVELGLCEELALAKALAEQHDLDFVDLDHFPRNPDAEAKLPFEFIKRHFLYPLLIVNDELYVATTCPPKKSALVAATYESGLKARPVVSTVSAIARALRRLQDQRPGPGDEIAIEI